MAKKDFSNVMETITEATQEVQDTQEAPKKKRARKTYTEEEAKTHMDSMNTSGRKGLKQKRINLAFAPEEYEYARTMARVSGLNITEFINLLVRQHREKHQDLYEKAVAFRNEL